MCKAVVCSWRTWVHGGWLPRLAPTLKYLTPEPRTARGAAGVSLVIALLYCVPFSAGRQAM